MIPFLDLKQVNGRHAEAIHEAVERVLASGWYILGSELPRFEQAFAAFCEARHAIGVANGLDALTLSLRALGIGPGDEVIVPSHTFVATWLAVSHVGATPVPVEPVADGFNIDPARIETAITPRTKVIIPVHLYGEPADLEPILDVARRHRLRVVEDAAQAHGARYRGRRIGAHGDLVCWSFYPGKNLGALGDGGAVTTDDAELAERLHALRNYGSRMKYHHEVIGFNSRLDELQAAVLGAKLPFLDDDNAHRSRIAAQYTAALANAPLELPTIGSHRDAVWHLYVVRHPQRDELAARLRDLGVATMIHYPVAPHLQPAYAALGLQRGSLPLAEARQDQVLSLPMGPTQSADETARVISAVREALRAMAS
ncbi:DegT/DnrJ/EryC1/StrS family aminotransferase [Piscinibacter koreensis]|uniref:DegT/DnrJ/EryC1/StrS family aminotransferase n=1 Tax=Piscinibacter koreensis TaxID=2742824 RepID=A0A7Y6NRU1_9BURK|nr:DegT/DnrJ/EryC1/StrS family aminotransferase [Schlegelella koreensis]NUZ08187.1 DegT/DnrJ/EryC1/StrS family aminotransferase [Schlegelella koreensis]